jgi:hypothetical protein
MASVHHIPIRSFALESIPVWTVIPSATSEEAMVVLDVEAGEGPILARCTYWPKSKWKDAHTSWEVCGIQVDGPPWWLPDEVRDEARQVAAKVWLLSEQQREGARP